MPKEAGEAKPTGEAEATDVQGREAITEAGRQPVPTEAEPAHAHGSRAEAMATEAEA